MFDRLKTKFGRKQKIDINQSGTIVETSGATNASDCPELMAIRRSQAVIEFSMDGNILYANENFLNVMGYSLNEVIGRHHSMFMDPVEARGDDYASFWKRLGAGEYFAADFRRLAKNRKEVWIQGSYNPIFGADGRPTRVVKFATDITATRLKNADSNGQIAAIGNTQAVITFSLDGRIEAANELFCKTMGYAEHEIIDKHNSIFVQRNERTSHKYREFWQALQRGVYQAGEFCRVDKNGRNVWLQASYTPILDPAGRPFKVVKYSSDITASKLRSLQFDAKLKVIGASTAVAEWNIDGRCLDLNPFLATRTPLDILALLTRDDVEQLTRGKQIRREITWPGQHQDSIWLDATFSLMIDLEGRPEKILMCAVDVTPRRRAIAMTSSAMQEMLDSMTKIVGKMDDIARTTNMLALNAGVQAARAGELGKGFAVVATEVRTLAHQSEKAVSEINRLIDDGKAQVGRLEASGTATAALGIRTGVGAVPDAEPVLKRAS